MQPFRTVLLLGLLLVTMRPARGDEETVRGEAYQITVSTTRVATVDQPAELSVAVVALGSYAMKQESPISLQVAGPRDVEVPPETLQQGDAILSSKGAEFRVEVTPRAAGDKALTLVLRFTVCNASACKVAKETVTFKLRVLSAARPAR